MKSSQFEAQGAASAKKRRRMENINHPLSVSWCLSALDLVTEFILIAKISDERTTSDINVGVKQVYNVNNNDERKDAIDISNNTTALEGIQFMNKSLYEHLGYVQHESYLGKNGGEVVIIYDEGEKTHCTVTILDSNDEPQRFHGVCDINESERVGTFKLQRLEIEERLILDKYFNHLDMFMTIVELGDDGTYDWRHVVPNKYCFKFYNSSYEQLSSFTASKRNSLRERKHFHEACLESKLHGIYYPKVKDITDTYVPLLGSIITYIGPHPITKRDLFACAVFDPEKLQMAHNRLTELGDFFEHAPMLMGSVKFEQGVLYSMYTNKAVAKLCGRTQDELAGIRLLDVDLFNKGGCDELLPYFQKARETPDIPIQFFFGLKDHNDKQRYFAATVSTLWSNSEKDRSMHVLVMLDLTKQKEAELELEAHKNSLEETVRMRTIQLQEKELRFRSLVSNAQNIILSVDKQGIVEYSNRNFVNDDHKYLVGKYLHALVVDAPPLMDKIKTLFETKKSFITEVKLLEAEIWLNISAGAINDKTAIIVCTDITEIKMLSEELHHALATKSRFLANMSHEVRTPLSGIIGMSRILMESGLNMDQTECVATIQYCGETLLSVINDVLDYTKLEATGMTLDHSEISIRQCIEESAYIVAPTAQKKNLELIIDIDSNIPDRILGDMLRLRQVIVNLLNNAVKFTDSGYVMISLSGKEIYSSEEWQFCCTVKDTGIGVPLESQGKLFQMFSQVDVSTTRKYGGTGIGLALAKRFLEMMNGDIMMHSSGVPGEGSIFVFNLTATLAPFTPVSSPMSITASPRWLSTMTNIFIIDDYPVASEVLKRRLTNKGFVSITITPPDLDQAFSSISQFETSLQLSPIQNKNILIICNAEKIIPGTTYPLLYQQNVATVLMGYAQPTNLPTDFPNFEFLRKPIKQSAFIRCLREIWGRFFDTNRQPSPLPIAIARTNHVTPLLPSVSVPQSPLNILVVEDNEMNQKVVRRVFQHLNYNNIPIANHGREALEMIEANGIPDLILMDVQMPVLDGVETTKIIRSKYPDWPFIVSMTADAFPEDRKRCLEAGMNDYLTKPIRLEQLQAAIQKCCKLKEAHN